MRKFVTIIIIIVSVAAGAMFIRAMFELEKEASSYLDTKNDDKSIDPVERTSIQVTTQEQKTKGDELSKTNTLIKELLNDPNLPQEVKNQPQLIMGELYEELFIELGFSDEEIVKFTDLTISTSTEGQANDQTTPNDEMKELIGDLYYEDYIKFSESVGQRIKVLKYKYKLASSNISLMPIQQENLLDLMLEDCDFECDEYILENSSDFLDLEQLEVLSEFLATTQEST